ncbi:MAG: hypothetical protein PHP26_10540 [Syntrophomonas sp.]|uniref:hypothetical protein n=1 Tax=Syntrophomonas sp. TaxID=2053627 RepID=UPI0026322D6E|nr:hypothetical protein [Syntrophomonas sp.]MDD2510732.1 hypothetical protein [Syntrophomonas sp.]MDD3880402.1 hypothetical protein [Syntrophomonas sp.]MDD4627323.1 hypothetical protein [Syntrophomonas sp.]
MNFIGIENLRLTDRNKAGGDAIFEHNGERVKAEFNFYLQLNECLSIRLGRHDKRLSTADLENFISNKRMELKKMVKPDVERLRREKRKELYGVEEFNNPHKNLP